MTQNTSEYHPAELVQHWAAAEPAGVHRAEPEDEQNR
jgi:hypothetical protein